MKKVSGLPWAALRCAYGGNSVTEIKERLFNHVWNQARIHGETKPPLIKEAEKSEFVRSRKVKIVYADMDIDGYLDVNSQGFLMVINKNLLERRKRTVIAHELAHTFLFDIHSNPIKSYLPLDWSIKKRWEGVEGLTFEIGRQILVPKALLEKYRPLNPSVELFEKLRKTFDVTIDVMARRLIHDLKLWDVFIFLSKFDETSQKFTLPLNKKRFRSKNSFAHFSLNAYWNIVQQKIMESCREEKTKGIQSIQIGKKLRKRYKIEVRKIGRSPSSPLKVLCMISPLLEAELDI